MARVSHPVMQKMDGGDLEGGASSERNADVKLLKKLFYKDSKDEAGNKKELKLPDHVVPPTPREHWRSVTQAQNAAWLFMDFQSDFQSESH